MQNEITITGGNTKMLFTITGTPITVLQDNLLLQKKISLAVLRLDTIHPVVSGNKLFKLHYFLEAAAASAHKTIITFGGAYSNHLAATAFACKTAGIKSIGIVRGEQPTTLSHTLQQCLADGMQLDFISREQYAEKEHPGFLQQLKNNWGDGIIVPEGGYGNTGTAGAALIWQCIPQNSYTHICTAAGTATTLAGILQGSAGETVIGIPVLKGMTDIPARIAFCCGNNDKKEQLQVFDGYHFGGYAKKTPGLLAFMNTFWQQHQIPTDFVYTAKLFYAVFDKIKNDHFKPGSKILCLHTGGLQGNFSLQKGSLLF